MVKTVTKSALAARLGEEGRRGFEEHKADDTVLGGGADLPAGIEGGVARLVECKFDVYKEGPNRGKDFFYAAGVVVSPAEFGGVRIEGLRTSIMEAVCHTLGRDPSKPPKRVTVGDHVGWVLNEFRKLGVETKGIEFDQLEDVAAALKKAAPHFRFRTWKGEKQISGPYAGMEPRVQHDWRGACEFTGTADDGVVDHTEATGNGEAKAETPTSDEWDALALRADRTDDEDAKAKLNAQARLFNVPDRKVRDAPSWKAVAAMIREASEKDEATDNREADKTVDHVVLGKAADGGEEEAMLTLQRLGKPHGLDDNDYATWSKYAKAVADAEAKGKPAAGEEHLEAAAPKRGDVYFYRPTPSSKKGVECEVTAVFDETVTLKSLDDHTKSYKGVPFAKLQDKA